MSPVENLLRQFPPAPQYRGLMVVATDTGVGKTLVAGAIARALRRQGRRVAVFKPAASGCDKVRGKLVSADASFLAACADTDQSLEQIVPQCFAAAAAPNVAAAREDSTVDLHVICDAYRALGAFGDTVIVEGIGGLLCPITDEVWVSHFADWIGLPIVIVARATLGTINHTLLTLAAARAAGLSVAGVVINRMPPDPDVSDVAASTNAEQIAARGQVRILAVIDDDPDNSVEAATLSPSTNELISRVTWTEILSAV